MQSPEVRREFRKQERALARELRRDKPRLFRALEEFANIRDGNEGWSHFRKQWPDFFPEEAYDRVAEGLKPSVVDYPYCLHQLWNGADSPVEIMLGIDAAPSRANELWPEDTWLAGVATIPAEFLVDWDEGIFRYRGTCDFQRALYLLFRESWRAKVCEKCSAKFIARRAAQKYCTTDCSEAVQRELKQEWWAENGDEWRKQRLEATRVSKGGQNGTRKAR